MSRYRLFRRFMGVTLSVTMILGMLPMMTAQAGGGIDQVRDGTFEALAEETVIQTVYAGGASVLMDTMSVTSLEGAGTSVSPYLIKNADDLVFLAGQVNEGVYNNTNHYFQLENDIDLAGIPDWTPIGYENTTAQPEIVRPFKGKFNGNGKTISGLQIAASAGNNLGLFGIVDSNSEVKGIALEDVQITANVGSSNIGGLVGKNKGTVTECYVTGGIDAFYATYVGGIVGSSEGSVSNCYSAADVEGGLFQGGIVGRVTAGTVNNCYSTGLVSGSMDIGGIAGSISGGSVSQCFSMGTITATNNTGGIAGSISGGSAAKLAALNFGVSGSSNVGRVIGNKSGGTVTEETAFQGMLIASKGSKVDGTAISTQTIHADGYFSVLFSNDTAWTFETKKLPILTNVNGSQNNSLPEHLASVVPSAPRNIAATAGDQAVTVTWQTPASNTNGITGYEVTKDNDSDWTAVGTDLTYTFTGLTNGQSYLFKVRAITSEAKGTTSTIEAISGRPPGKPTELEITTFRDEFGNKRVKLTWAVPDFPGDSPITGYQVSIGSMGVYSSAGNDTEYIFTESDPNFSTIQWGVANQEFRVYASNVSGNGAYQAIFHRLSTVPASPQALTATPDESGNVVLAWNQPTDTGGEPVTGYRVSKDNGGSWTEVVGTTHTFSGLINNLYSFAVQGYNTNGWGASATTTATAIRKVIFTDGHTELTVERKSAGTLTFTASSSGSIAYSLEGTIPAGVAINAATGVLTVDGNETPAGNYGFEIQATDASTNGKATKPFTLTINKIIAGSNMIVLPNASGITYGQTLGNSHLTGASEYGTWQWQNVNEVPPVVNSGYPAVFIPSDTENYDWSGLTLTDTVSISVNKAIPGELTWPVAAAIGYGSKLSESALTNGVGDGTWQWQNANAAPTVVNGGYPVVFTPNDTANYDWSGVTLTKTVSISVNKATPGEVTWPVAAPVGYGSRLSESALTNGAGDGTWQWENASEIPTVVNSGYPVVFTPNDTENYDWSGLPLTNTVNISVTKADVEVEDVSEIEIPYNQSVFREFELDAIAFVSGSPGVSGNRTYSVHSISNPGFFSIQPAVIDHKLTYTSKAANIIGAESIIEVTIQSENYTDKNIALTFKAVDKKAVVISGLSINGKTYDGTTIALSGMASIQGGEVDTATLEYRYTSDNGYNSDTPPRDAGIYTLTVKVPDSNTQYMGFKQYPFVIEQREIILKADDKSVILGSDLPNLTYSVQNIIPEQSVADALVMEPILTSPMFDKNEPGSYPIILTGGTATANYTIAGRIDAVLTVEKQSHLVTVVNGIGGGSFVEGVDVNVIAVPALPGQVFEKWTADSAGVTFVNENSLSTSFTMPDHPVKITANYRNTNEGSGDNGGSGNGGGSSGNGDSGSGSGETPQPQAPTEVIKQEQTDRAVEAAIEAGEKPVITIDGKTKGAEISANQLLANQLLANQRQGNELLLVNQGQRLSLSPQFIEALELQDKSAAKVVVNFAPSQQAVDRQTAENLMRVDPLNQTLAGQKQEIDIRVDEQSVGRMSQPIKVTVDVSELNLTDAQKANLSGVLYDTDGKIARQLGGEFSADGKMFSYYTYQTGEHGVIVSGNLKRIEWQVGSQTYTANGESRENDVAPVIAEDRTLLPLRSIAEALGAGVEWNGDTKTVAITKDDKTVYITIGEELPQGMGTAVIREGRTLVPLRYIAEQLGANVVWDAATKQVSIYQ